MKNLLTALIVLLSINLLNAQITVTLEDVQNQYQIGTEIIEKIDTVSKDVNIGNLGSGNFWDFSNVNLEAHITYDSEIISPVGTPFEDEFPSATWVTYVQESVLEATGEIWWYGGFGSNNVVSYGYGSISESQLGSISAILKSAPAEVGGIFPMTLGTNWSYSGEESYLINTGIIPIETTAEVNVTYLVDASGTLKLPSGREVEALRLYEIRERDVQIYPGFSETYTEILFTFFAKTGEEISITLLSEEPGATTGVVTADAILWNDGNGPDAIQITDEKPNKYTLKQNYPNPFNPSTTIEYSVTEPTQITLKVYDMLGKEVSTLVREFQTSGTYREQFNANNLPSGNYIIHLQAGNYSEVKKMTLLK